MNYQFIQPKKGLFTVSIRKLFLPLLLLLAFCATAQADMPQIRGYDAAQKPAYQYVTFGAYPYSKDGEIAPVLWRVLGPGMPGVDDVINASNCPNRNETLPVNGDVFTNDTQDVFVLMTEYIIDFITYHDRKDKNGKPLDYVNSMMHETLNTEVIAALFSDGEQVALVTMPERGLLGLPTRKGELHRADYGFVNKDFTDWPLRVTTGTPYAFAKGLRNIDQHAWYWTTDWRRYGYRWIVGDDGHISVSGVNREGGIRPVCYVHTDMLDCLGGDGTKENPYQLVIKDTH